MLQPVFVIFQMWFCDAAIVIYAMLQLWFIRCYNYEFMMLQLRIRDVATTNSWCCNVIYLMLQLQICNIANVTFIKCCGWSFIGLFPFDARPGASKPQYFCKLGKKMPNLINPLAHSLMEIGKQRQTMKKTDRRTWRRQAHVLRLNSAASP